MAFSFRFCHTGRRQHLCQELFKYRRRENGKTVQKIRLLPYESKHSGFFARIQTNIHLPQAMSVAVILDL